MKLKPTDLLQTAVAILSEEDTLHMISLDTLANLIFISRTRSPGKNTIVVLEVKYSLASCAYSESVAQWIELWGHDECKCVSSYRVVGHIYQQPNVHCEVIATCCWSFYPAIDKCWGRMQQTTVLANTLDLKFCSVTLVYWEFVLYNNSERLKS